MAGDERRDAHSTSCRRIRRGREREDHEEEELGSRSVRGFRRVKGRGDREGGGVPGDEGQDRRTKKNEETRRREDKCVAKSLRREDEDMGRGQGKGSSGGGRTNVMKGPGAERIKERK